MNLYFDLFYHRNSQLSRSVQYGSGSKYAMTAFNSKWKYEKLAVVAHVPQTTQNMVISRSCFAEDRKEICKNLQRFFLIKPFTRFSRCRLRRSFLKFSNRGWLAATVQKICFIHSYIGYSLTPFVPSSLQGPVWTLCTHGEWLFSGSSDKTIKVMVRFCLGNVKCARNLS